MRPFVGRVRPTISSPSSSLLLSSSLRIRTRHDSITSGLRSQLGVGGSVASGLHTRQRPGLLGGDARAQIARGFHQLNARIGNEREHGVEYLERFEMKDGKKQERDVSGAMNTGKLLTTPSRLFKLLMPLATVPHDPNRKEPVAILIHPQQPLSYLERLIQSEVPEITTPDGQTRPPAVSFIALQLEDNAIRPKRPIYEETDAEVRRVAEINESNSGSSRQRRPDEEEAETYSYLRRTEPGKESKEQRFVRWSLSTEVGDFIRDAARGREFIVTIESAPGGLGQIRVEVPSFSERTYFLRMRLRKISQRIQSIADIKHECDALAHRGAQRVAICGFGVLASWWFLVYKLTFETDLGWDTMEPVTYLASLSTIMCGYLWFLYHNREISYRSALDFTISARQKKLYNTKGVDLHLWEGLIVEGNALRKEIKSIAAEYDVDWDERGDEQDDRVTEALKQERRQKNGSKEDDKDKDNDD